jgi:hypothetical protein
MIMRWFIGYMMVQLVSASYPPEYGVNLGLVYFAVLAADLAHSYLRGG